jgi:hypothetical protein
LQHEGFTWQNIRFAALSEPNERPSMVLTKRERKALAFYDAHRNQPPTFGDFVPKLILYFLINTAFAVVVYILLVDEIPGVVWFFVGMLAGAFLRDIRRLVFTLQLWPFTAEITDWQKVEELAVREGISASEN